MLGYFGLALADPALLTLTDNPLVVGLMEGLANMLASRLRYTNAELRVRES